MTRNLDVHAFGQRLTVASMTLAITLLTSGARAVEPATVSAPPNTESSPAPSRPATEPGGEDPHGETNPHAHGHGEGDLFQPPQDGATEDPALPEGTLKIHIEDPSGKPVPNTEVYLGVLYNSVAKGESQKRLSLSTDADGIAKIDNLETGSTVAYRPMVLRDGAKFSATPFRMPERTGMRVRLHVYPVVESLDSALVVSQTLIYSEVKDDRIQIQQAFRIYNFGKTAWVPNDLLIPLPENFTAFTSQQGMSDVGVDPVSNKGVRLHGTFSPGQHVVEFRWQLPYSGASEVRFDVGMAPRTAAARVMAPASKEMTLEVPGFPPTQSSSDGVGQRTLLTEKQIRRDDPALSSVSVVIRGLPTEGPGKLIATAIAAGGLLVGIVLGTRKPPRRDRKREQFRILVELEHLERAWHGQDVGPKTYESERRALLDDLARVFEEESTMAPPDRATRARRRAHQ